MHKQDEKELNGGLCVFFCANMDLWWHINNCTIIKHGYSAAQKWGEEEIFSKYILCKFVSALHPQTWHALESSVEMR